MSNQPLSLLPHRGRTDLMVRTRTDSSASPSLSHARLSAQILDAFLQEGSNSATPGPLSSALQDGRARDLTAALAALPPEQRATLRNRCGERFLTELTSLSHERDEPTFHAGLLNLGMRQEDEERLEGAAVIYSALAASPAPIAARAQTQLNAIRGVGAVGPRLAFLGRRLADGASDGNMLLSMAGAQMVFGLTRIGLLGRFLSSSGRLANPVVAEGLAGLGAFAAEGSSFVLINRGLMAARGAPLDWSAETLGREFGSSYLNLGLLRAFGGASSWALRRIQGRDPAGALLRVSQTVLPQVAMFGGIYTAHLLEPHIGLSQGHEGDTAFADSLAMLLQFNVAGHLMNRALGPGFTRFNHELHLQGELLGAAARGPAPSYVEQMQSAFGELFGNAPELALPGGGSLAATPEMPGARDTLMAMMIEGRPGESTPPPRAGGSEPPGGSTPPPSGSPSDRPSPLMDRLKVWANRLNDLANWRAERRDMLRHRDPNAPLSPVRRTPLPSPVESIEQGMRLAIARGNHGERQVWHTRRVLDLTREMPRTREAYLEAERARVKFQTGIRERLDPILQNMPMPDYRPLSEATLVYEQSVREVLGSGRAPFEADALLNLYNVRRVLDPAFREGISNADLIRMGLEPQALEWVKSHVDTFLPGAIETILARNPELARAPGAEEVLAARRETNSRKLFARTARTLSDFVADPNVGKVWLTEVALQASTREMMRRNPGGFLLEVLNRGKPTSLAIEGIPAYAERVERYKRATEELNTAKSSPASLEPGMRERNPLAPRDFRRLHRAMGEYLRATTDLLIHHENDLIPQAVEILEGRLDRLSPEDIATLHGSRSEMSEAFQQTGEGQREIFLGLEPQIREFFRYYDTAIEPLREQGSRVGMTHVEELLDLVRNRLAEGPRREAFDRDILPRFREIQEKYEAALVEYHSKAESARQGTFNPRDYNRTIEKQVEHVYKHAYGLVFEAARMAEPQGGRLHRLISAVGRTLGLAPEPFLSETRRILPFYETFAGKADLPREMSLPQRLLRMLRYGRSAFEGVTEFKSAQEHGYPFEAIARIFQRFGSDISKSANPQTFYYDPALQNVVDYFHYAISADHNTHLDFIGHADNIVMALLGDRAGAHSIPDILAKIDLDIPLIKEVFPYLTNMIPNDPAGVRRSEVRATQMQAFGSLPHERVRPTMPLGYDNITMDVTNGEGPYVRDPHAPTSGSLPVMGRPLEISEGAAVITGRPQGIVFAQDPGAIRNYPSQRGSPALLNNPSSMVAQFFPMSAMPEPAPGERVSLRNNVERLIWYLQGFHPETDPAAPQTDAIYRDYRRPLDPATEQAVSSLFNGAWEVYPTAEGISRLETQGREARTRIEAAQRAKNGEAVSRALRDYELVQQVLDVQTRQLLRTELTVFDQRLATELAERPGTPEAAGLRRAQRILRSRLKLMNQVERKIANREELSLTERRFVEKAGTAIAGRDNVSGTDHTLEQLNYYFAMRDAGVSLQTRLLQSQGQYYEFVRQWNEGRKDPSRPEYSQVHVSEAPGYREVWEDYRIAMETIFNLHGHTPHGWSGSRLESLMVPLYNLLRLNPYGWNGEIFPDVAFRRDGESLVIEPRGWERGTGFSRPRLWRFLGSDTMGIVPLAIHAKDYDPSPNLYLSLHRAWGHRAMVTTGMRVRLENTGNFRDIANTPTLVAPTHDSMTEFPILPSVLHDYGIQAFFLADKKFFDPGFHPPTFGTIPRLLGPMAQYGHFEIDRSNRELAIESMKEVGAAVAQTGKSAIVFPAGTRNPVRYRPPRSLAERLWGLLGIKSSLRFEGPLYGTKPGIGLSLEGSQGTVLPLGLVNGGVIAPKQFLDAFVLGGTATGREYGIRVGTPLSYATLVPDNPAPRGGKLRTALTSALDRQFSELTGRPIAPPAASKAKTNRKPD